LPVGAAPTTTRPRGGSREQAAKSRAVSASARRRVGMGGVYVGKAGGLSSPAVQARRAQGQKAMQASACSIVTLYIMH
jgi:hypothetical protein